MSMNPITPVNLHFANAVQALHPAEGAIRGNQAQAAQQRDETGGITFADMLMQLIDNANITAAQMEADSSNLALGLVPDGHLHTIMINAERADLAFRTFVSVRNSVLEAYQEVLRINV